MVEWIFPVGISDCMYAFSAYEVKGSVVRSTDQAPRDYLRDKATGDIRVI